MVQEQAVVQKRNYNLLMESELQQIAASSQTKQTLLLHACCAPCSSAVLERLADFFSMTIYYYNPNIHPEREYMRRLDELQRFICIFPVAAGVKLVVPRYDPEEYFVATNVRREMHLQSEPEQGERCRRCYRFRMESAYQFALENKFDYMTTTLSISPHKDAEKINAIGMELERGARLAKASSGNVLSSAQKGSSVSIQPANNTMQSAVPKFLFADFKKKNGFKRSLEISAEYGLYRQEYCGCVFSCGEL